ncbi:chromate efflux transporter [Phenylobacterium ferrooxidans]|uniref:Chromate efflux transporter n=1 Tax=Phenylobacterium ferrooxidans TaxID=2982689 RepID=A0ABW6CU84_9CAUL
MSETSVRPPAVPFGEAVKTWARIAALSFGGPAGQIAVMHRILVEEKRWLGERRFLHALNYCMLLPGPEAQQLAIYIGWLMHRTAGGLVAGLLFVLPGFLAIMALSILYALYGGAGPVSALFFGLKAAVLVVVLQAVIRVGGRSLRNPVMIGLAAAAFVGIYAFDIPFPVIILAAGLIGFLGGRARMKSFLVGGGHGPKVTHEVADADTVLGEETPDHARPHLIWALQTGAVLALLWLAPVLGLGLAFGWDNVFSEIAVFFSKMAVVTFGGAYAVLAYVAQEAVQTYGWLKPGEMLDGLGMAETTPGPLIIVTQFVGFMGAYRNAAGMDPLTAGVLGGILTTWVTFVPCFLWIFLGAPFVEALRGARALNAALAAITAAVVGVILNLAIWFALHVLFAQVASVRIGAMTLDVPDLASVNLPGLLLSLAAGVAAFRFKVGVIPLLLGCAGAGVAYYLATGGAPPS